jgi:agmatinase
MTPFSEDRTRLHGIRLTDLGDIEFEDPEQGFPLVRQKIESLANTPIILGGDHSITIPVFEAQRKRFEGKRLGILWVDAHPDLCDVFNGSNLSHACVLRRGLDTGIDPRDVCLVGVRSWEEQEIELIENGHMHVFSAADVSELGMKSVAADVHRVLSRCDAVHVSLDIDCLDPAAAPGTGIPEAGGLTSREVLTLIQSLQGLRLAGLDVVEVAPPLDPSEATVFAALKIIMEYIALFAREKQRKHDHASA